MSLNIAEVSHTSDEVSGSSAVRYFDYTIVCMSSVKWFLSDEDLCGSITVYCHFVKLNMGQFQSCTKRNLSYSH